MQTAASTIAIPKTQKLVSAGGMTKIYTTVSLLLCMAFSGILSHYILLRQSLRLDESQSLWQSSHSPERFLNIVAQDVHVPLYGLMLHFWQVVFGTGVSSARLLSLIFFLATIPLVYALGKKAYNRSVGLFAAVLLSVSPFMNWYANEIRMYSLLTFLTVASHYLFLTIYRPAVAETGPASARTSAETGPAQAGGADEETGVPWYQHPTVVWTLYAATALVGIYVHYFFALVLATQALFYLMQRKQFPAGSLRRFAVVGVLVAAAITPWLWYVFQLGLAGNTRPVITEPSTINLFNTFSQFMFGFQNDHLNSLILSLWPLSVLLVFVAVAKNKRLSSESLYFLLGAFFPILLAFTVSITFLPLFLTRYLIFSIPALYLLLGWFLSSYSPRTSLVLKTALVAAMLVTLTIQTYNANAPVKENYQEAAEYLSSSTKPADIIALSAPFTVYPIEYYYKGSSAITTLPKWNRYVRGPIPSFNPETLPEEVEQLKAGHDRLFLLLSYDQGYQEDIRLYFEKNYQRLESKEFSPGLSLWVYQLRY